MKEIKQLLEITNKLKIEYFRRFTLDGKLVGDIGEVLAKEHYNIELHPEMFPDYDAYEIGTNKQIQIKSSFHYNFYLSKRYIPDYYLALNINEEGEIEEIYNGTGDFLDKNYIKKNNLKGSGNEYGFSHNILRELNKKVDINDKIEKRKL